MQVTYNGFRRLLVPVLSPFFTKNISVRSLASSYELTKLQCIKYGEPIAQSLELVKEQLDAEKDLSTCPDKVVVKLVASSINPADINVIQGKYGHLPKSLPAVIGNEGLFEVIEPGRNAASEFRTGDWVVVTALGAGTWSSHMVVHKMHLMKMDKNLGMHTAATMLVNPVTAYLLLHSFVKLIDGDNVLINAPTSTVGRALLQLCRNRNLKATAIVRDDHLENAELVKELRGLGATFIVSNSDLRDNAKIEQIPRSRLALNCVGGKHATDMMRLGTKEQCTMVTYGGLSMQPLIVGAGNLIFRDHRYLGFWLSRWREQNEGNGLLEGVVSELTQIALEGKLQAPRCKTFPLDKYADAFVAAQTPHQGHKILLTP